MSQQISHNTSPESFAFLSMCILRDVLHDGVRSSEVKLNDFFRPNGKTILNQNADTLSSDFVFTGYHYHDGVEILQVNEGTAKILVDDRTFLAGKGDIVIVNPFQAHAIFLPSAESDFIRTCITFQPAHLFPSSGGDEDFFGRLRNVHFLNFIPASNPANASLSAHLNKIVDLYRDKQESWPIAAFGELILFYHQIVQNDLTLPKGSTSPNYLLDFMVNVGKYIDDHLSKNITTSEIAGYCQYTPEHFCRLFRKCFGQSFKNYMNNYRIQKAKFFIDFGKYPTLSETAAQVGFPNRTYFGTMFKKYVGMLPSEYVNQQRKGNQPSNGNIEETI